MLQGQWSGIIWPGSEDAVPEPETGVDAETLKSVGKASVTVPEGFVSGLRSRSRSVLVLFY